MSDDKIVFMDEFAEAKPKMSRAVATFILQRPTLGKSKMMKKAWKKLNKKRRKQGLKKLKVVEFKVPKGWKAFDAMGFPIKR